MQKHCIYFGAWNVRSLVDNEGRVETARLSSGNNEPEDHRIDLVIREQNWCKIKVAALQKTKRFGNQGSDLESDHYQVIQEGGRLTAGH